MLAYETDSFSEKAESFLSKVLFFFLLFTVTSILISFWIGYFWKNSLFIALAALAIGYFLYKRFHLELKIPLRIYLYAFLFFLLATYHIVLITPYYSASIDVAQTITVRILDSETIPLTYEPYSGITATYYMGYHLFARIFIDLFPIMQDFQWMALLGALIGALQVLFVYLLSKEFFKSPLAAEISAILFLGTRVAIQNVLWGMHPMLLGTLFMMAAAYFYLKRNSLSYLFFPVTFALHTGAAVNILLLFAGLAIYFKEKLKEVTKYILSMVLVLPSILTVYLVVLLYLFSEKTSEFALNVPGLLGAYMVLPLWLGIVPVVVLGVSMLYIGLKKKQIQKLKEVRSIALLLIVLVAIFSVLYLGFVMPGLAPKLVVLMSLLAILLGGYLFSNIKISSKFPLKLAVILACVILFANSGFLSNLQHGTDKISPEEAEFAFKFREFDPDLKKVFFLMDGDKIKVAEYANKIPFDKIADFPNHIYFPLDRWQTLPNEAYGQLFQEHQIWEQIYSTECLECISDLDIDYLIIDKSYFTSSPEGAPVFNYGNFAVYKIK